jgi:hypothetical protein
MAYVEVFSRGLIGLVFLLSGCAKTPSGGSLSGMRLLRREAVRPVAAVVVAGEARIWMTSWTS